MSGKTPLYSNTASNEDPSPHTIHFYIPEKLILKENINWNNLLHVLRPFWTQSQSRTLGSFYKDPIHSIALTKNIHHANAIVIPMSLGFYYKKQKIKLLIDEILNLKIGKKKIILYNNGDLGYKIPSTIDNKNLVVLRYSGYRSKLPPNHLGIPVLRTDPFKFLKLSRPEFITKFKFPTVGFCGQALNPLVRTGVKYVMRRYKWCESKLGFSNLCADPQPLVPTVLRMRVLKLIERNEGIKTDYILRTKYKAGIRSKGTMEESKIRKEFYNNINSNLYTVCIRGTGNFSARYYETLSMGRIPIVLDTDQLWPYEKSLDYSRFGLNIRFRNWQKTDQLILEYHYSKTSDELLDIQKRCRQLWEDRMTLKGLMSHFNEFLH